jgi:hypothetical protein
MKSPTSIVLIFILSVFGAVGGEQLKTHPFLYEASDNLVKANPENYAVRIANPRAVIELFRHKEEPKALLSIAGRKVEFDFVTFSKGIQFLPDRIAETIPAAHSITAKKIELGDHKREFVVFRFKIEHDREEIEIINLITQEGKDQFHFTVSFPVGTPKSKIDDLLMAIQTLRTKQTNKAEMATPMKPSD